MATHWSDWLFWIGGWTLAGGGALLLIWALRGDRSRSFRSQILPPYMRRSPNVAEVLPILYLRGPSTGDFLGSDLKGKAFPGFGRPFPLSRSAIARWLSQEVGASGQIH